METTLSSLISHGDNIVTINLVEIAISYFYIANNSCLLLDYGNPFRLKRHISFMLED